MVLPVGLALLGAVLFEEDWVDEASLHQPFAHGSSDFPKNIIDEFKKVTDGFSHLAFQVPWFAREFFSVASVTADYLLTDALLEEALNLVEEHHLDAEMGMVVRERVFELSEQNKNSNEEVKLKSELLLGQLYLWIEVNQLKFAEPDRKRPAGHEYTHSKLVDGVRGKILLSLRLKDSALYHEAQRKFFILKELADHLERKVELAHAHRMMAALPVKHGLEPVQGDYHCEENCDRAKTPYAYLNGEAYSQVYQRMTVGRKSDFDKGLRVLFGKHGQGVLDGEYAGGWEDFLAKLQGEDYEGVLRFIEEETAILQQADFKTFFEFVEKASLDPATERVLDNRKAIDELSREMKAGQGLWVLLKTLEKDSQPSRAERDAILSAVVEELRAEKTKLWEEAGKLGLSPREEEYLRRLGETQDIQHATGMMEESAERYNNEDRVGSYADEEGNCSDPAGCLEPSSKYFHEVGDGYAVQLKEQWERFEEKYKGVSDYVDVADEIRGLILTQQKIQILHLKMRVTRELEVVGLSQVEREQVDELFEKLNKQGTDLTQEKVETLLKPIREQIERKALANVIESELRVTQAMAQKLFASHRDIAGFPELVINYERALRLYQGDEYEKARALFLECYHSPLRATLGEEFAEIVAKEREENEVSFWISLAIVIAATMIATVLTDGAATVWTLSVTSRFLLNGTLWYFSHEALGMGYAVLQGREIPTKGLMEHGRDLVLTLGMFGAIARGMKSFLDSVKGQLAARFLQRTGRELTELELEAEFKQWLAGSTLWNKIKFHVRMFGAEFKYFTGWNLLEGNIRLALKEEFDPLGVLIENLSPESLGQQALFLLGLKVGNFAAKPVTKFANAQIEKGILGEETYRALKVNEAEAEQLQKELMQYLAEVELGKASFEPQDRVKFFVRYLELLTERARIIGSVRNEYRHEGALEDVAVEREQTEQLAAAGQVSMQRTGEFTFVVDENTIKQLRVMGVSLTELKPGVYSLEVDGKKIFLVEKDKIEVRDQTPKPSDLEPASTPLYSAALLGGWEIVQQIAHDVLFYGSRVLLVGCLVLMVHHRHQAKLAFERGVRRIRHWMDYRHFDARAYFDQLPDLTPSQRELLAELYPKGLDISHLRQGRIGDCHLVSTLYGFKQTPLAPYLIAKMIRKVDKGWEVTFPDSFNPVFVSVKEIRRGKQRGRDRFTGQYETFRFSSGALGDRILERALGKVTRQKRGGQEGETAALMQGGFGYEAFDILLGRFHHHEMVDNYQRGPFSEMLDFGRTKVENVLLDFAKDPGNHILWAATPVDYKTPWYYWVPSGRRGFEKVYFMDKARYFVQQHAYVVTQVDAKDRTVTVINPHDTGKEHIMSFDDFYKIFSRVEIARYDRAAMRTYLGDVYLLQGGQRVEGIEGRLQHRVTYHYSLDATQGLRVSLDGYEVQIYRKGRKLIVLGSGLPVSLREGISPGGEYVLGRLVSDELPASVSGRHLKIAFHRDGSTVALEDLASRSGTRVLKETRIPEPAEKGLLAFTGTLGHPLNGDHFHAYEPLDIGYRIQLGREFLNVIFMGERLELVDRQNRRVARLSPGQEIIVGREHFSSSEGRTVSANHVHIIFSREGHLLIKDLNSSNGTMVFYNQ
ncbi:MAG: hypothetical protein HYU97_04765 [Deltaproteobacteria bacterium]|nr:hypothetical protein [Deltaproteobacteria bacterium]